jgi:hypothetical protein
MYDQKADFRELYFILSDAGFIISDVHDEEEWNECAGFEAAWEVVSSVDYPTLNLVWTGTDINLSVALVNGEGPGELVMDYTVTGHDNVDMAMDNATMLYYENNSKDGE